MRLSIDGVCTKLLTLTKGQQPPYRLRCAPSAKGGSFARRGLPASATSTHRPLPLPETKARRRSRQQHRRRAESGSNAACCPCYSPTSVASAPPRSVGGVLHIIRALCQVIAGPTV